MVGDVMNALNRVLLPLRSNIGWFQSFDLRDAIHNRVKESVLLYDELYIEDGTFTADVVDGCYGAFTQYIPQGYIPPERRTIEYERDLKQTNITIGIGPEGASAPTSIVLDGNTSFRFKIDYYEIFKDIEISDYDFLKLVSLQSGIRGEVENEIKRQSWHDESDFKDIHPNKSLRKLIIENLNHDLIASIMLNSSVVMDFIHHELLKRKCWNKGSSFSSMPVPESVALHQILEISVPNFSKLSLEDVIERRYDPSWNNFREFIRSIVITVRYDPEILANPTEIEKVIQYNYEGAKLRALKDKSATKKLAVELGLGFASLIPGYGIIPTIGSMAKSFQQWREDKNAWYAFILKMRD